MKTMKRIHAVTIKRMSDDSPDTSWMGEYASSPSSEFSIDRQHSLDCPVNAGTDGRLLWHQSGSGKIELQMTMEQAESVSHSGDCDDDVLELSKVPAIAEQLTKINPAVLAAELKEYGAWDETELADHEQNLQRIVWLAGCDVHEQGGCDCGERGDMGRNEYRYFNPSFNYVTKDGHARPENTPDEVRKYVRQDYERMESLNHGNWGFIGIRAEAEISVSADMAQEITSGGLWGIESDSDKNYFAEVEKEELASLRDQLTALGFSKRAIATAFKNVERS
jgi:hypothetical protein